MTRLVTICAFAFFALSARAQAQTPKRVQSLRVTILSTMLADQGLGEWGFAAIVEVDGHRILFDTGGRPDTVLQNTREMAIDLTGVTDVILSHNHLDHTAGLLTLRREFSKENRATLSRAHVGKGIFLARSGPGGRQPNPMVAMKPEYEATGGTFIDHTKPVELWPGVWLTGPVPRKYPERNFSRMQILQPPGPPVEDTLPEDQSLVLDTDRGLVLISGCGHSGIINTLDYARQQVRNAPIHAAIGGFHLYPATDAQLEWTAGKLREFGLQQFIGAHCTGIEATYRIRQLTGLTRGTAVVGAVGGVFTLPGGIAPGSIAR